jgi:hypothetical protein
MTRKVYLLDHFSLFMFESYPEQIVIDKAIATEVLIAIANAYEYGELVNTISDEKFLRMIEKEEGIRLPRPTSEINVKLEKHDKAYVVQNDNGRYIFFEIWV